MEADTLPRATTRTVFQRLLGCVAALIAVLAVVPSAHALDFAPSANAATDPAASQPSAQDLVTKTGTLAVKRHDLPGGNEAAFSYRLREDSTGTIYQLEPSLDARVVNPPDGGGKADALRLEGLNGANVKVTGSLNGRTIEATTIRVIASGVPPVAPGAGNQSIADEVASFFNTWAMPLMLLVFVALLWVAYKAMPRSKPQQIKPQSASSVKWDDVAGCEEAKHELREVVEFLRDPERFKRLGASMPKGVLLHGPPGTGKTLLAKAVAHESGANFFSQSASSFVEMFAGLGAARIRKLFAQARKHAPAILFIDELDAIGMKRGFDMSREKDQTLNQLLVEMDGFNERGDLVVIAASNRIDSLDDALLRPGRFDRQVLVSPPDLHGRIQILGVHTRGKPLEDVDLKNVARQTSGLTGADLANLCNEAAIFAGRSGRDKILDKDFDGALERVVAGLQTRRVITPQEKRIIAYHEAGHALVGELLRTNVKLHRISIVPRGQALGYVLSLPEEDRYLMSRQDLLDHMSGLFGGYVAEQIVFGRTTTGPSDDLRRIAEISRSMIEDYGMGSQLVAHTNAAKEGLSDSAREVRDSEQQALIDEAQQQARQLILEYRDVLNAIAERLLEKETLDREEIEEIIDRALGASGKVFPQKLDSYGEPHEPREPRTRSGRFDRNSETAAESRPTVSADKPVEPEPGE